MVTALVGGPAAPASAHPLGNFAVSHYHGLTLHPDRLEVLSVVDRAEIPSVQALPGIDTDGDGEAGPGELAAAARAECPLVAAALAVDADGRGHALEVTSAGMAVVPGDAGLPTLRLTCTSAAEVDVAGTGSLTVRGAYLEGRVGWREMTATGEGVRLEGSAVPAASVSDELREYPEDLLSEPLDVRSVELAPRVGEGRGPAAAEARGLEGVTGSGDPVSRLLAAGDGRLQSLVSAPELTWGVGLLAVALSALLGAGHAVTPGHGKTVMAAYLAGRRGRRRDAFVVGATVTLTHTVGVLVLGLALTLAGALAGDRVLQVLGVVSGVLVAVVGLVLLRDAWRDRVAHRVLDLRDEIVAADHAGQPAEAALVTAGGGQTHGHGHGHGHGHRHSHEHEHEHEHGHSHGHRHSHEHEHEHEHGHSHSRGRAHGHSHGHPHPHTHGFGARGLVGLGVAGGLVPSPSALVVLLGAVALGRTAFGVLLVLAYGLGMAATLTAVGLLLVRARARLEAMSPGSRLGAAVAWLGPVLPLLTAGLVVVVGIGLAVTSLA